MTTLRRIGASPGRVALTVLGLELAAALALAVAGATVRREVSRKTPMGPTLAASLQLTDLSLWSAASYCRHPSQADVFSAHGEHPAAPDHFPAGSIVAPPRAARGHGGLLPGAAAP